MNSSCLLATCKTIGVTVLAFTDANVGKLPPRLQSRLAGLTVECLPTTWAEIAQELNPVTKGLQSSILSY